MMYLVMLLQQLIASSTHLVAKSVTGILHPTTVVLFRGLLTCSAFGVWWLYRRNSLPNIDRADWKRIFFLGFINITLNQILFIWGVKYTTAPNGALAYALCPAFVVALLAITVKHNPGWKRILGIIIALIGAAIVLVDKGAMIESNQTLGNIMVLGASASWAVYTVYGRKLIHKYGPIYSTALTFFSGIVLYLPVWALLPVHETSTALYSDGWQTVWFQLFYLGVITSTVGYGLWFYALSHMDSGKVAVFNNLQPIFTTLLALVFLGTEPTMLFVIGGVVALAGVILTQRS